MFYFGGMLLGFVLLVYFCGVSIVGYNDDFGVFRY